MFNNNSTLRLIDCKMKRIWFDYTQELKIYKGANSLPTLAETNWNSLKDHWLKATVLNYR